MSIPDIYSLSKAVTAKHVKLSHSHLAEALH